MGPTDATAAGCGAAAASPCWDAVVLAMRSASDGGREPIATRASITGTVTTTTTAATTVAAGPEADMDGAADAAAATSSCPMAVDPGEEDQWLT